MEKRELICIGCPTGCVLHAEINSDGDVSITGNSCKIGVTYGVKECTNPTRILTSSVEVIGTDKVMLPIKTKEMFQKIKL